jgi:hypothetical protein
MNSDMPGPIKEILESWISPKEPSFSYSIGVNTDEGWFSVGNGNQEPAKVLAGSAMIVPAAIVAGVALPALAKAKAAAAR